jgi:geranylgeranyl diphosphate synthase type II
MRDHKLINKEIFSISELQGMMETYLDKEAFSGFPGVLFESTNHIMRMKGKRIRPVMCLAACQAFGGNIKEAMGPASAVEVYHNFSLVHDDIIDEADIRRGTPTVHKMYGLNKAILTGDAMLLHSFVLLKKGPDDELSAMLNVFSKATTEVMEGEQYDVNFEEIKEVSEEEYMLMIKLKTSVLLAAAFQIGAIIGNASPEDQQKIYDFGLNLGLAFQIKDDYLDCYGDEKTFGKRIGGDILMNKKTYLLVTALISADAKTKNKIFSIFNEKDEKKKIAGMLSIYDDLDIKEATFSKMEELYQQSLMALDQLSIDKQSQMPLYRLAEMVYQRTH